LLPLKGVQSVEVCFVFDPPWSRERITLEGREKLKQFGIAVPDEEGQEIPPCPYCHAKGAEVMNLFGPTSCRAVYYCKRCRQPFEGIKRV
jgi:ring-1,2-phenylacetyl-CoA epoxidase subunit PaaD